jgi:hypothetical protein
MKPSESKVFVKKSPAMTSFSEAESEIWAGLRRGHVKILKRLSLSLIAEL